MKFLWGKINTRIIRFPTIPGRLHSHKPAPAGHNTRLAIILHTYKTGLHNYILYLHTNRAIVLRIIFSTVMCFHHILIQTISASVTMEELVFSSNSKSKIITRLQDNVTEGKAIMNSTPRKELRTKTRS